MSKTKEEIQSEIDRLVDEVRQNEQEFPKLQRAVAVISRMASKIQEAQQKRRDAQETLDQAGEDMKKDICEIYPDWEKYDLDNIFDGILHRIPDIRDYKSDLHASASRFQDYFREIDEYDSEILILSSNHLFRIANALPGAMENMQSSIDESRDKLQSLRQQLESMKEEPEG